MFDNPSATHLVSAGRGLVLQLVRRAGLALVPRGPQRVGARLLLRAVGGLVLAHQQVRQHVRSYTCTAVI